MCLHFTVSRTMCENSVHYWETPYAQPFFDNTTKRDITATVGQPALLHCRVRNLGDRAVSLTIFSSIVSSHTFCSPAVQSCDPCFGKNLYSAVFRFLSIIFHCTWSRLRNGCKNTERNWPNMKCMQEMYPKAKNFHFASNSNGHSEICF